MSMAEQFARETFLEGILFSLIPSARRSETIGAAVQRWGTNKGCRNGLRYLRRKIQFSRKLRGV